MSIIQAGDHEPDFTPRELAQQKIERFSADLWWTARALVELRSDPDTRDLFRGRAETDLWSAKTNIDVLLSELRATDQRAA